MRLNVFSCSCVCLRAGICFRTCGCWAACLCALRPCDGMIAFVRFGFYMFVCLYVSVRGCSFVRLFVSLFAFCVFACLCALCVCLSVRACVWVCL